MVSRSRIKRSLIEELRKRGADNDTNRALVEDYLSYCRLEAEALKSLREKGSCYKAISSTGKEYDKDNPAKKDMIEYSKRKLDILKALGINERWDGADDFADDEL